MEPLWILPLVALISALIASLISAVAARVRFSASRGLRWTLDILFLLPLAVPEITAFFAPYLAHNLLGHSSSNPPAMIIATDMIWAPPVVYLCAIMGFRNVTRETMDAARLQGLGDCGIFWGIFLPTAWAWITAGFGIAFFRSALLGGLLTYR